MKKEKTKEKVAKSLKTKIQISVGIMGLCVFGVVFANDILSIVFPSDTADGIWSSSSLIQVFNDNAAPTYKAEYWNKWNNSTVIGNYFRGYYYDSVLGFFRLDEPSIDPSEWVRITASTWACPTGYWYKLWGYAYSDTVGFMDFDYNSNIFVYYCESDKELHGYGYSEIAGLQNFEGIGFEIIPNIWTIAEITSTGVFVNDVTNISDIVTFTGATSNYDYDTIGGDTFSIDATQESIFYIIK